MAMQPAIQNDIHVSKSRAMLLTLSAHYGPRDFAVRFWDGSLLEAETGLPQFTLVLQHPGALRAMLMPFDNLAFGNAYIFNDFDVEGDMHAFFGWVKAILNRPWSRWQNLTFLGKLYGLPNTPTPRVGAPEGAVLTGTHHTQEGDAGAIEYAYNLSNAFYELFLDKHMQYTCAYFHHPEESIDVAQERKLDLICRKLRLKPGQKFLDVGCGWGGLIIHAAKHYGVEAVGITLSKEQAAFAEGRIKSEGLTERCKIVFQDYRNLPPTAEYDAAATVGMAEHVGEKMMPELMQRIKDALKPQGVYLHHSITLRANTPYPSWTAFARRYVFPNGEVRPILTALKAGEWVGFEIRDVESLREHYIHTLEKWVEKLEAHHDEAVRLTNEVTYRIFRIYLTGAAQGFRRGLYNLYQTLFVKPDDDNQSGLPLTREGWYHGDDSR